CLSIDCIMRQYVVHLILFDFILVCLVHTILHTFPTRRSSDLGGLRFYTILGAIRLDIGLRVPSLQSTDGSEGVNSEDSHIFGAQIGRAHVNSSHVKISYAVFCLKKKKIVILQTYNVDYDIIET